MNENLLKRLKAVEDYHEVINCFHRYLQYYALHHKPGVLECLATEMPDVSVEEGNSGKYIGKAALEEYFERLPKMAARRGILTEQLVVSPEVIFAGDRKTAKITSLSPGIKVIAPARSQAWRWGKFYVDMIETERGWKIWHLHWFETFEADMERGPLHTQFAQRFEKNFQDVADIDTTTPTEPSTYFHLFDPKTRTYNLPEPQDPYDTYTGMTDLKRARPYQNPDIPESMEGEVETVISLGKREEAYEDQ